MSQKVLLRVLGRILKYMLPYWKLAVTALVLTVICTALRLCQAKFVGYIMDLMSRGDFALGYHDGQDPFLRLNLICGTFISLMTLMGVATYFQKYTTDQCGQLAIRDFRNQVFASLQRLPASFFDKMRSGEVLSRSTTDIITSSGIYSALSDFVKNSLTVIGCFAVMFYRDWQMTLVILVIAPLLAMAIGNFGKRMGQRTSRLQARLADLSALQYENVAAIKVVKAYSRETIESERFIQRNEDNYTAQMKVVQVTAMQSPTVELLGILGIMIIVWFGATRIMQGQVSFAQMSEYWTLMVMTSHPIQVLSTFYSTAQNSAAAGARALEIIDTTPETTQTEHSIALSNITGRIEFKDLHFGYTPEKEVLKGINLTVEPGKVVAIVGTNGAGKSTLVNMVPRFYEPTSGTINIDGRNLAEVTLDSLRSQIGIVFQESVLFQGTIADNIRVGLPSATEDEVKEAARLANADEFISTFPQGYDTQVGERGAQLSGGQRQRLAIARALIRKPRILILDEYTSGIDAESENLITEVIERAMQGRTCLVIAHRLNTIRYADHIIVMDSGRIVEQGQHDELLAQHGLYEKIYEAQRVARA